LKGRLGGRKLFAPTMSESANDPSAPRPHDGTSGEPRAAGKDFIRQLIDEHNKTGRYGGVVHTRFPPEPNGYLHIGHAKSICLNFGLAEEYGGVCNLRFDDTNPEAEEDEYVRAIEDDVRWLGFDWGDNLYYASDFFDRLYEDAKKLIREGKAYVDSQSAEQIRETRGTIHSPGTNSPYRDRSAEENLALFEQMKNGELPEGAAVLRAKIDMAAANLNMRDPAMYRIRRKAHHRTGDRWCIYPMYDWAHGQCDSYEGITHSICTLEFEHHRPLYDWFVEALGIHHPRQIEFARLNLTRTVLSKRKLLELVRGKLVDGWDDPRMPTLRGMRRRGFTPAAIRAFCTHIGVAKFNSVHEIELLEYFLRQDLNKVAQRRMAVLDPIKLVITNWPEGHVEHLDAVNNPENEADGSRTVPFSGELYIEREDFLEDPPKKFFRLGPGREVRLRWGYFVTCTDFVKNDAGEVTEIHCTYDPETKGGDAPDGRKVKGTIHWVSAAHAVDAEVRLYDHLLLDEPEDREVEDFKDLLNPNSLEVRKGCKLEPSLAEIAPEQPVQFERIGYFVRDSKAEGGALVFNRTVGLRDTWAKQKAKG
jgi:glutaminyl-tRNA synthetase